MSSPPSEWLTFTPLLEKIRLKKPVTSFLLTLISPFLVVLVGFGFAIVIYDRFDKQSSNSYFSDGFLAIWFLLWGIWIYGFKRMGLSFSIRHKDSFLIILAVLFSCNALFSFSIETFDLSRTNIPHNIGTGIWEEIVFRGFFLAATVSICGERRYALILLINGIAFSLIHLSTDIGTFYYRSFPGIVYTAFAIKTGTIFPLMLFHALHNSLVDAVAVTYAGLLPTIIVLSTVFFSFESLFKSPNNQPQTAIPPPTS